jgi:glycosyltransferase involved in cell wall biosynthesis
MPKISAVIITFNEGSSLDRCLASLDGIADEIIVVDSFSTDSTEDICKNHGVRFIQHEFTGYMNQKNFSLTLASNKYVLSLDADEALSEELLKSLLAIKNDLRFDGYYFNRLSNFCGQWIRHSAWYPDRQLRLFNKELGKWGLINVHESFRMIPGTSTGKINGDLLHWPFASVEDYLEKIEEYSDIASREYFIAGKKVSFLSPAIHMTWRFILNYFLHLGFLDGRNGCVVCSKGAWSSYLKYNKLRKLNRERLKNQRQAL